MASAEELQQKIIELDLSNVPPDQRSSAKEAVANYIIDEINTFVAGGTSPVTGKAFKELTEKYADKQKGGDTNPNLYLEGDMLSSLGYKNVKNGISVGIMDASQRPKADGHNNFSGDSKLPQRRFIAGDGQNFVPEIMDEIPKIIADFEVEPTVSTRGLKVSEFDIISSQTGANEPLSVTLGNILTNNEQDLLSQLLKRIIR